MKIVVGQHLKLPEHLVRFSFFFFPFLTFNDHNWDVVLKMKKNQLTPNLVLFFNVFFHAAHHDWGILL